MSKHQVYTEEEIITALKSGVAEHNTDSTLYDSDENCDHIIKASLSGGIECMKCGGWFCY